MCISLLEVVRKFPCMRALSTQPLLLYFGALLISQLVYNAVYGRYGATLIERERSQPSERFLIVDLFAFGDGAGLGNLVFELVGVVALARRMGRTLVVHSSVAKKMQRKYSEMGELARELRWNIPFGPVFNYRSYHCCRFNPDWPAIAAEEPVLTVKVSYLQSFHYFSAFSLQEIRRLLSPGDSIREIARTGLLDEKRLLKHDHRLCVHSRRGDFLRSKEQAPSTGAFTVPAVEHLIKQLDASRPLVIMIGDDLQWQRETASKIRSAPTVVLPRSTATISAVVDWQFAEIYCDSVLLTAPASTFGWWLAYVSRGQRVFYSSVYQKGDRFGDDLLPAEFFPPSWSALELSDSGAIRSLPRIETRN